MTTKHAPVLIIGSGPAGYTAAVYAARAMLKPMLVAGLQQGGQLMITTDVENYPGFADPIQGPWLMEQMLKQAEHVGTDIINDIITEVDLNVRPFRAKGDSGTTYTADALIIATGAQAKWLGIPTEQDFMGFGVSACATCDGFFYRGKDVAVVGGGNSAVEEALYLSVPLAIVIDRIGSMIRTAKTAPTQAKWHHDRHLGHDRRRDRPATAACGATGNGRLKLRNVKTGETRDMVTDGVFVAIGHAPAVELFKGKLRQKPNGYLWTASDSTATDVPGVFAAGDVTDDIYRQAVTAAGMGCMAALETEKYLAGHMPVAIAAE